MYEDKINAYFSYCRSDLLQYVPQNKSNRILEIGAGSCATLLKAKESGLAGYVVGVDLVEVENSNQSNPAIDRFIIGNIENLELNFDENSFDVILCGDVLEHLVDPWQCLIKLRPYLRKSGIIIGSMPNVRYWKTSMGLFIGGRWIYSKCGILDKTHLRFFVKSTMRELFEDNGFTIQKIESMGPQRNWGFASWAINNLTFRVFSDLLTFQYVIVASK